MQSHPNYHYVSEWEPIQHVFTKRWFASKTKGYTSNDHAPPLESLPRIIDLRDALLTHNETSFKSTLHQLYRTSDTPLAPLPAHQEPSSASDNNLPFPPLLPFSTLSSLSNLSKQITNLFASSFSTQTSQSIPAKPLIVAGVDMTAIPYLTVAKLFDHLHGVDSTPPITESSRHPRSKHPPPLPKEAQPLLDPSLIRFNRKTIMNADAPVHFLQPSQPIAPHNSSVHHSSDESQLTTETSSQQIDKRCNSIFAVCCISVILLPSQHVLYHHAAIVRLNAPYIPSFFAFREAPSIIGLLADIFLRQRLIWHNIESSQLSSEVSSPAATVSSSSTSSSDQLTAATCFSEEVIATSTTCAQSLFKQFPFLESLLPSVIVTDSSGTLHDFYAGLAVHISYLTGIPCFGISKSEFICHGGLSQIVLPVSSNHMTQSCNPSHNLLSLNLEQLFPQFGSVAATTSDIIAPLITSLPSSLFSLHPYMPLLDHPAQIDQLALSANDAPTILNTTRTHPSKSPDASTTTPSYVLPKSITSLFEPQLTPQQYIERLATLTIEIILRSRQRYAALQLENAVKALCHHVGLSDQQSIDHIQPKLVRHFINLIQDHNLRDMGAYSFVGKLPHERACFSSSELSATAAESSSDHPEPILLDVLTSLVNSSHEDSQALLSSIRFASIPPVAAKLIARTAELDITHSLGQTVESFQEARRQLSADLLRLLSQLFLPPELHPSQLSDLKQNVITIGPNQWLPWLALPQYNNLIASPPNSSNPWPSPILSYLPLALIVDHHLHIRGVAIDSTVFQRLAHAKDASWKAILRRTTLGTATLSSEIIAYWYSKCLQSGQQSIQQSSNDTLTKQQQTQPPQQQQQPPQQQQQEGEYPKTDSRILLSSVNPVFISTGGPEHSTLSLTTCIQLAMVASLGSKVPVITTLPDHASRRLVDWIVTCCEKGHFDTVLTAD